MIIDGDKHYSYRKDEHSYRGVVYPSPSFRSALPRHWLNDKQSESTGGWGPPQLA